MSENSSLEPDLNGLGQKNLIKLIKRANNYALLLLIEIQYSVVAMVVIGTPAIIYNNEKKSVLKNHSGLLKKKKKMESFLTMSKLHKLQFLQSAITPKGDAYKTLHRALCGLGRDVALSFLSF